GAWGRRAQPARPATDAAARRGARRGGAADAPHRAIRGLRRADHLRPRLGRCLGRAIRPLRRRAAGDGRRRRDCQAAPGRPRQRGVGAWRELLRGARRRPRVSALHASGRLSRLEGAGRPPLGRSRTSRRVEKRPEPSPDARSGAVRSPYEVLGVPEDASDAEIFIAYSRLTRGGDEPPSPERLAEIRSAYETLSDPARRAEWDAADGPPTAVAVR